jgi:hypothetical protein
MQTTLPTDSEERKNIPMLRGCVRYFPAALMGVAKVSDAGNKKHNPGEELHHARGKSMDHGDCIIRHLMDVQDWVAAAERSPIQREIFAGMLMAEVDQLCWRALALSQELHERFGGAPLAPGAKVPSQTPGYVFGSEDVAAATELALKFDLRTRGSHADDMKAFNAPNPVSLKPPCSWVSAETDTQCKFRSGHEGKHSFEA